MAGADRTSARDFNLHFPGAFYLFALHLPVDRKEKARSMIMNHFYSPTIAEGTFFLPEEEAHHAASVLRSKAGDRIGILDGKGTSALAEIVSIDRKKCGVKVIGKETFPPERSAHIHIA